MVVQLQDLDGLEALTQVTQDVELDSNGLTNLDALSGLKTVGDNFHVNDNNSLTDISGLSALVSVGTGGFSGGFFIRDNDMLCQTLVDALFSNVTIDGAAYSSGNNGACP